jgi:hypothetical protein
MPGNVDIDGTGSWPTRMSIGKFMGKPLETDLVGSKKNRYGTVILRLDSRYVEARSSWEWLKHAACTYEGKG